MKKTVLVESQGQVVLTDKNYLASGGEASVYSSGRTAYKIYHEPAKMISLGKIEELNRLSSSNVLKPKNIIRDKSNVPIGYTMKFIKTTHPVCKLFTKAFRKKNKVGNEDIVHLVREIQQTVDQVHKDKCLIVDLNEMNLLASKDFKTPYFIDVDSYQTPSYRATAIMESIRDPLVHNNEWTELSDWFSFAVLAFYLYIGVHPYRGKHPHYAHKDLRKRMDDGISVFNKDVSLPRVCNDLSVIPLKHRSWLEAVFVKNERSIPPMPDDIVVVVQVPDVIIEEVGDFEVHFHKEYKEDVIASFDFMGVDYTVTTDNIYKEGKPLRNGVDGCKVSFCESSRMSPVVCKLKGDLLTFEDIDLNEVGKIKALDMMYRNGAIYSIYDGKMIESSFDYIGSKIIHKMHVSCNVLDNACRVFDGVVFQDLLGKHHITLPYEKGKCLVLPVKELDGFRILEAKGEKNIVGVVAEKKGIYYRFVFVFDDGFKSYKLTRTDDVTYGPVNFTVMQNGLCVMALDSEAQIFKGDKVKVISNPPFDTNTRLFNKSGGVFFIDKNKTYSVKMK